MHKTQNSKYDNLYLNILQIGRNRASSGLSYNDLKKALECKGYDFTNDCIELAVKQWFFDSFEHYGLDENPYKTIQDLEKHLDCNFILKGDSCLRLIEYETSENGLKVALTGIKVAYISLFISAIAIFYTICHDYKKDKIENPSDKKIEKNGNLSNPKNDTIFNVHYHYQK